MIYVVRRKAGNPLVLELVVAKNSRGIFVSVRRFGVIKRLLLVQNLCRAIPVTFRFYGVISATSAVWQLLFAAILCSSILQRRCVENFEA